MGPATFLLPKIHRISLLGFPPKIAISVLSPISIAYGTIFPPPPTSLIILHKAFTTKPPCTLLELLWEVQRHPSLLVALLCFLIIQSGFSLTNENPLITTQLPLSWLATLKAFCLETWPYTLQGDQGCSTESKARTKLFRNPVKAKSELLDLYYQIFRKWCKARGSGNKRNVRGFMWIYLNNIKPKWKAKEQKEIHTRTAQDPFHKPLFLPGHSWNGKRQNIVKLTSPSCPPPLFGNQRHTPSVHGRESSYGLNP